MESCYFPDENFPVAFPAIIMQSKLFLLTLPLQPFPYRSPSYSCTPVRLTFVFHTSQSPFMTSAAVLALSVPGKLCNWLSHFTIHAPKLSHCPERASLTILTEKTPSNTPVIFYALFPTEILSLSKCLLLFVCMYFFHFT